MALGDVAHGDQPVNFATALVANEDPNDWGQVAVEKVIEEMTQHVGPRVDLVMIAIVPGRGAALREQIEDRILGVNSKWCKCGHREGHHYPGISAPRLCDVEGCPCKGFEEAA